MLFESGASDLRREPNSTFNALDRRKRHERNALAARGKRQELFDQCFEVLGVLMRAPPVFVDVQLENEKQVRVARRAIRDKEFDPGLGQGRGNKLPDEDPTASAWPCLASIVIATANPSFKSVGL